jgi:hypothetical protein
VLSREGTTGQVRKGKGEERAFCFVVGVLILFGGSDETREGEEVSE